ncbi:MAG TPA: CocE/NonD family hydrolase [bacterium]|nr:CocE/NonD family hydrolase [bacterium]
MPIGTLTYPVRTATRIDETNHVREDAMFVRRDGSDLFCVLYRPQTPARRTVVLCPSFSKEAGMLYRLEVDAARAFAVRGYAAVRVHYRGTGHSGGDRETATLRNWADDAKAAADIATELTQSGSLAFCGIRAGALVAGLAVAGDTAIPVALWEPVSDGRRYFPAFVRAQNVFTLATQGRLTKTLDQVRLEIETDGYADVLGFPVYRALYESLAACRLWENLASEARSILLVQVGVRNEWKAEHVALGDVLAAAGSRVERVMITGEDPSKWFVIAGAQSSARLIETTLGWLGRLEGAR